MLERALRCFNINISRAILFSCSRYVLSPMDAFESGVFHNLAISDMTMQPTYSSSHFLSAAVEKIGSSFACLHADSSSLGLLTSESCQKFLKKLSLLKHYQAMKCFAIGFIN